MIITLPFEKEIKMTQKISLIVLIEVKEGQREKQINIYKISPNCFG